MAVGVELAENLTKLSIPEGPWPLPQGWCWAPLKHLSSFIGRGRGPAYVESGGVPVVNQKCIRWRRLESQYFKYTAREVFDRLTPELHLKAGDLLWNSTGTGTIGRALVYDGSIPELTFDSHVTLVRPASILPAYLGYFVETTRVQRLVTDGHVGSTNQQELPRSFVQELLVPLAPLAEQCRIVARMDALFAEIDEGMGALAATRNGLDKFRRALLKAAVTGELTKDWRATNPVAETGHDILARIANGRPAKGRGRSKISTEPRVIRGLPPIPQCWAWARPSEIQADLDNALTIGPFGSNLKVSDYRQSGVPLIFVRHIRSEDFRGGNPKFVTENKARELASHKARAGDILITKMGAPPGDACRYPDYYPDAIITADCIKWTIHDEILFKDFYVHFINSAAGRSQILEKTTGVAHQKVSLDRFRQIYVPVPPPAEAAEAVRRVSEAISACSGTLAILGAEAADAARLKQSILKAAFEGRLSIQDPADEPASGMIERLRAASPPETPAKRERRAKL